MKYFHASFLSAVSIVVASSMGHTSRGDDATVQRTVGAKTYTLQRVFQDNFDDLRHWSVESTGTATTSNQQLVIDCHSNNRPGATVWCRQPFSGPTVIEYTAVAEAGANNLNFILYASNSPAGLLETTEQRTGAYPQYHVFPNYIVTYLTAVDDGASEAARSVTPWRVRFRKNPGFNLLTERFVETTDDSGRQQLLTYVFEVGGHMSFCANARGPL
jgi:hypothetical protein